MKGDGVREGGKMYSVMVFYMAHAAYRPLCSTQYHRRLFIMSIVQAITTCVRKNETRGEKKGKRKGEKKGCELDRGRGGRGEKRLEGVRRAARWRER